MYSLFVPLMLSTCVDVILSVICYVYIHKPYYPFDGLVCCFNDSRLIMEFWCMCSSIKSFTQFLNQQSCNWTLVASFSLLVTESCHRRASSVSSQCLEFLIHIDDLFLMSTTSGHWAPFDRLTLSMLLALYSRTPHMDVRGMERKWKGATVVLGAHHRS